MSKQEQYKIRISLEISSGKWGDTTHAMLTMSEDVPLLSDPKSYLLDRIHQEFDRKFVDLQLLAVGEPLPDPEQV